MNTWQPLTAHFGVRIEGPDLRSRAMADEWPVIQELFNQRGLVVFRDQHLDPGDLVAWSLRFGDLRIDSDTQYLLDGHPEVLVIGNLVVDGVTRSLFVNGAEEWHFDGSYMAEPSLGSLFYAVEVPPEGGDTLFADMVAAYEALDDDTKRLIEDRVAVHSWEIVHDRLAKQDPTRPALTDEDRVRFPPVGHRLVQRHPETGRKCLRVCADSVSYVEGLSVDEGLALVERLMRHAIDPRFIYRHRWRKGDLIAFDNRRLLHTATVFDTRKYLRVMHRTTIVGHTWDTPGPRCTDQSEPTMTSKQGA